MRAPPICRYRAGWERFLRSLPRLASVPTASANIRPPLSPTIDCQIRYGLAVATIMALRGPTTAARITAGPPFLTAAACPMSAAYTAIAETRPRGEMPARAVKECVLRVERCERVGVELIESCRPFLDDTGHCVVGHISHRIIPSQQLRYALDQAASPFSPDFLCKGIAQA